MKAYVQYNDYEGTTAADRSDLFTETPGEMTSNIMNKFGIKLPPADYRFIGVSVNGTKATEMLAYVFFKEFISNKVVKCTCYSVNIQTVLDLFKRFEFQVGEHLEDIDIYSVEEVVYEEGE
jgi:hypothetical protein